MYKMRLRMDSIKLGGDKMIFKETRGDLFKSDNKYTLMHCISHDCAMGAGIAKQFDKLMPSMKNVLKNKIKNDDLYGCFALLYVNDKRDTINLITKEKYWHKPSYSSLKLSLLSAKNIIERENIKYIAMPVIGCGLDRLQWSNVSQIIKKVFEDTDVEIVVYHR